MTVNERIDNQSFCYDPEFPPDVAEGLPLEAAKRPRQQRDASLRKVGRACAHLAGSLRRRSS